MRTEIEQYIKEAVTKATVPLLIQINSLQQEVRELRDENKTLKGRVRELEAENKELKEEIVRLKRNSSNSSKPPSSDIVKPVKKVTRKKGKRKKGGQKGHPRHQRDLFPPEKLDETIEYTLDLDESEWELLDEYEVLQQVELKDIPFEIFEYRARQYQNRKTGEIIQAAFPDEIKAAGFFGPRLTAYVAYLKGCCHLSYTGIQRLLKDSFDIEVSRGHLANIVQKASTAIQEPYEEMLRQIALEEQLNIDETGHKENGIKFWTWCFCADLMTVYKIDASRGSKVLEDVLGTMFKGVIGCDYYSAYRKYMKNPGVIIQFCLAHLIREIKFLSESSDKVTANYGKRLLNAIKELFAVIHKRDKLTEKNFQRKLIKAKNLVLKTGKAAPDRDGPKKLARRFKKHGKEYFTFVTTPGIEPTNNLAERALRFIVIQRKMTQGTRSIRGRQWCERIWSIVTTCAQQGRSCYDFINDSVHALFNKDPAPSLLPANI